MSLRSILKKVVIPIRDAYRTVKDLKKVNNTIFVDGYPDTNNFGDALNVPLVAYLSGRIAYASRNISLTKYRKNESYAVIGSVCHLARAQTVVWGAGFIEDTFSNKIKKPKQVVAVRGPLTREVYLRNGVDCPPVYGDPALLLPFLYNPSVEAIYEYGVIHHFLDWGVDWVRSLREEPDVLMIDVMTGVDYQSFVKEIKKCKKVITNSLHGLIMAHAYGIPVCLIKLTHGTDFKFKDYLLSVNKPNISATIADKNINLDRLTFDSEYIQIDLAPLIKSCPFIIEKRKADLLKRIKTYNL